nr:GntR family transcriptional regulator [Micromonospora cremea]
MCEHYEVSNTVIRAAMLVLTAEGLIDGPQGKGMYVANPRPPGSPDADLAGRSPASGRCGGCNEPGRTCPPAGRDPSLVRRFGQESRRPQAFTRFGLRRHS